MTTSRLLPALAFALCACATGRSETGRPDTAPAAPPAPAFTSQPAQPYTALGQAEAQEKLLADSDVRQVDKLLRAALQRQALQAHADGLLEPTFTTENRWLPPLPNSTIPRRIPHRVARAVLIRYGSSPQTP